MTEASPRLVHLPRDLAFRDVARKFFYRVTHTPTVILFILGFPSIWIGHKFQLSAPYFVGIVLLLLAITRIVDSVSRSPSTEDEGVFDEKLEGDAQLIQSRALRKIEMNVPLSFSATAFGDSAVCEPFAWRTGVTEREEAWGNFHDSSPSWNIGSDGKVRYRIYRLALLFLAEHHLAYYLCDFNMETGLILAEETLDCHYKDVKMFNYTERKLRSQEAPDGWRKTDRPKGVLRALTSPVRRLFATELQVSDFSHRKFDIGLGSTQISIPIGTFRDSRSFEEDSTVDPVVSRIRFLLREKRMSYVRMMASEVSSAA